MCMIGMSVRRCSRSKKSIEVVRLAIVTEEFLSKVGSTDPKTGPRPSYIHDGAQGAQSSQRLSSPALASPWPLSSGRVVLTARVATIPPTIKSGYAQVITTGRSECGENIPFKTSFKPGYFEHRPKASFCNFSIFIVD